eukprot:COSAG02_NODE_82119_length_103_cov_24.000000_1_plen_25_part_10
MHADTRICMHMCCIVTAGGPNCVEF